MKITSVSVRYGELRSSGYPNFSNTRHEIELTAELERGDDAASVQERLFSEARRIVKQRFGPPDGADPMMSAKFVPLPENPDF